MSIGEQKYVSVTTYRRSGAPVSTATWITPLDGGRVGFWTSSASGKAKRLRNNSQLTLRPSDQRGRPKPGTTELSGTAVLLTSGPEWDAIHRQIKAKYRVMVPISRFFNTLGHLGRGKFPYGDLGVVVTLAADTVTDTVTAE
ncbi:MAG TPA: PPOX class F420-dependent oxidoreductase [Jatrophihabitans sp.]|nr:PPOX class F420-dependent oxidoreductase [Jatrophihabitans sp.]